jgi:hypothetical protein
MKDQELLQFNNIIMDVMKFIHDNYDIKIDQETAMAILTKYDDFLEYDAHKELQKLKNLAHDLDQFKQRFHYFNQLVNIRLEFAKLNINNKYFNKNTISTNISSEMHDIIITMLELLPLTDRYSVVYYEMPQKLMLYLNYLACMDYAKAIELYNQAKIKFYGGNHTGDNRVRHWVQSRIIDYLLRQYNIKYQELPNYLDDIKINAKQLIKAMTKEIFFDCNYLAVCKICKSKFGAKRGKKLNQDTEKQELEYWTNQSLFEHNRKNYAHITHINTRNDSTNIYRSLNDMVKFYLMAIVKNNLPNISDEYQSMADYQHIIKELEEAGVEIDLNKI